MSSVVPAPAMLMRDSDRGAIHEQTNPFSFFAWRFSVIVACLFFANMNSAIAQTTQSQDDIVVEIDQVIDDCPDGGYYPLPIKVQNRGPAATIRIEARMNDQLVETVGRTIVLGQNASSQFSLLIPMVSRSSRFELRVTKDGRWLDSIKYYLGNSYSNFGTGSWLVIADSKPNLDHWKYWKQASLSSGFSGPSRYSGPAEPLIAHVVPSRAFETWLAYTSLDTVAVDARAVTKLSETQRNELLRWVSTGGTLLVYETNLLENQLEDLDRVIDWESRAAVSEGWSITNRESATEISRKPLGKEACESERLLIRGLMLGRVVVIKDNPFDEDAAALLATSSGHFSNWIWNKYQELVDARLSNTTIRNGVNPRTFAGDFLKFINPGIQIVPTWGFIILITLFAILIGPANYWLLRRRNKLGSLLWTTPLLALVTTIGLLGWSSIANGTGSRVRLRSFTWLDQRSQVAVSLTRAAMFSGRVPRNGIRFEPYSAVYPVWPQYDSFNSGDVDWTDAQVLDGDFHSSNTRSQFYIVTPRTLRSRLRIEPAIDDHLPVSNGLEWALESILVRDHQGNLFVGDRLKPGESQKLRKADKGDVDRFAAWTSNQKLVAPRVNNSARSSPMGSSSSYGPYGYIDEPPQSDFGSSYLERYMGWIQRDLNREGMTLPPGTWLGIVAEHPDLDLGLKEFSVTEQLHVMMGTYDE